MTLSNKLKYEVNDITMSTEMKERILHNIIGKEDKKKIKKYSLLKNSLELTAACCTLLVCAQLVKTNPEIFKFKDNISSVKEECIDYSDNSRDDKDESQSASSSSTSSIIDKDDEDQKNKYAGDKGENVNSIEYDKKHKAEYIINNSIENNNDKDINIENNNIGNNINNHSDNNNISTENGVDNPNDEIHDTNTDNIESGSLEGTDKNEGGTDIFEYDSACGGSPVSEFKTIEEAEKALSFKANLIKDIDKEYRISNIAVLSGKTLSIEYSGENKQFTYRESIELDDISGDYNKYEYESMETLSGNDVTLKGNSEKLINAATWRSDEKSYSIFSEDGIKYEDIMDMVNSTLK